jgi:hypothetical protein
MWPFKRRIPVEVIPEPEVLLTLPDQFQLILKDLQQKAEQGIADLKPRVEKSLADLQQTITNLDINDIKRTIVNLEPHVIAGLSLIAFYAVAVLVMWYVSKPSAAAVIILLFFSRLSQHSLCNCFTIHSPSFHHLFTIVLESLYNHVAISCHSNGKEIARRFQSDCKSVAK